MYRSRLLSISTVPPSSILPRNRIGTSLDCAVHKKLNGSYQRCYSSSTKDTIDRYDIVLRVTSSSIRQDSRQRVMTSSSSSNILYPVYCRSSASVSRRSLSCVQKRYYMDVHTRPSHSGMFQKSADNKSLSKTTTISSSSSSSNSSKQGDGHNNNNNNHNNDDQYHQSPSFLSFYQTLVYRVALTIGIIHITTEHIGDVTLCEGPSMYPTIYPSGEIIYIDKLFVKLAPYLTPSDSMLSSSSSWIAQERIEYAQQKQNEYEQNHLMVLEQLRLQDKQCKISNKNTDDSKDKRQKDDSIDDDDDDYYYWYESKISVTEIWEYWNTNMTIRQRLIMALQHLISPLNCGDVVVLQHPTKRHGTVCKRIIGMPGDQILILNGNTTTTNNGGGGGSTKTNSSIIVVPDGHVWVEGDNPNNSSDSRNTYGCIPASLIIGRVLFRIWPFFHLFSSSNNNNSFDTSNNQHRIAWMVRGTRPKTRTIINPNNTESILLPAGYEGQEINKTLKK